MLVVEWRRRVWWIEGHGGRGSRPARALCRQEVQRVVERRGRRGERSGGSIDGVLRAIVLCWSRGLSCRRFGDWVCQP